MEQQRSRTELEKRQSLWEQELRETGAIADEGALLSYIKTLDDHSDAEAKGDLLAMAGKSRANRGGHDALVLNWMEKALELNPANRIARGYLSAHQWKGMESLFEAATFPPLRETDNRAAKRKTAEQIIQICRQFLDQAETHLDELETAAKRNGQDARYLELKRILQESIEESALLLKAAEGYEQSISGVFHTSVHYDELKNRIKTLEEWKAAWASQFEGTKEQAEEDPLEELNSLIGLKSVKERVSSFYSFLKYQKKRRELGFQTKDSLSLNMVLTGNPGTGKTTIARLLAKIYFKLGVLPRAEVIEADRSQLVGAYVGQTEENVRKMVEKALGGVLFIDEAYSLKREGQTGNDYGQTAIDTLVSLMTGQEYGGRFAVILAGYPEEMRQFLDANPGLRSRFPQSNLIHLPDYDNEELMQIGEQSAADNDYVLSEGAKTELMNRIERERVDDTFGNARSVINIIQDAIFTKGAKVGEEMDVFTYSLLERDDFALEPDGDKEDAREQLSQLIGLNVVKEEVQSLISFVRMQQLRRDKGLQAVPIQLHSVFTGNPGTGKTTVAKIYAQLLKDCGILKRGHLIVGSRADFVAGYVGQTAIKTKKKIREALGGVLFIDEAYSLLSQGNGDFGKEVIDTLVDEMTRHNENLVVILAGYPDQMNELLESNPGLRSRFKKFFHFPDYTAAELLEIMENYAGSYQYKLSEQARSFILETISAEGVAGNGRFATNVIDEAVQAQAFRLMDSPFVEEFTEETLCLQEEDLRRALDKMGKGEF
ncbi:stage V sporulation protein K [Mesobacillus campisalis]|uniref:Stage V sporulation protein K n=1 Tax=Mesobacillus campisalis TaxID=1408103 RepID=A0A0M2SRY0_9BACI|nr:AAA family ATPase [Mesobacillus campisalis]KKK37319.1 stage V sporulation protein K [Mesobacillus campisalis]